MQVNSLILAWTHCL